MADFIHASFAGSPAGALKGINRDSDRVAVVIVLGAVFAHFGQLSFDPAMLIGQQAELVHLT